VILGASALISSGTFLAGPRQCVDPACLAVVAQIGAQALVGFLRPELDRVPLWRGNLLQ